MKRRTFCPTEIIFACTSACNLKCEHCFVDKNPRRLEIEQALAFLENCVKAGSSIDRVGFSGGEPFLYMEFLLELTRATVAHDLLFDQIMTNGDWWHDEEELNQKLQTLYDAGYDGKIGLSWDKYHGQPEERMITFIKAVQKIFGEESINIQRVEDLMVVEPVETTIKRHITNVVSTSSTTTLSGFSTKDIRIYTLPRTYPSENPLAWKSKKWFKEDYCEGPGQILYVHANGNIAPCCGFANENPELFIGTIKDSYETIMKNASQNEMVQLCFVKGLSRYRRFKKYPGKTSDICTFCDFVCKQKKDRT